MQLITLLSKSGEVGEYIPLDQFDGLAQGKCGYDAVAVAVNGTKPGTVNPHSVNDLHTMAHNDYVKYAGPDVATDPAGMNLDQCHSVLRDHGLTSLDCTPDWNKVRAWLKYGYPVIVCIPESSVTDTGVGGSPYPWAVAGIDHIIIATGQGNTSHTIKFRDSADIEAPNNLRTMPRDDSISVAPFWAVVVVEPWLSIPPVGFDPTAAPGGSMPVTQTQYDELYAKLVSTENAYNSVRDEKNAKIAENSDQTKKIAILTAQLSAAKAPVAPQISQAIDILQKLV